MLTQVKKLLFFMVFFLIVSFYSNVQCSTEVSARKMQDFVIKISEYARKYDPDFIIIPQNGIELAFNNTNPNEGFNYSYLQAIDGIGVEELFYDGTYSLDYYRLSMLEKLKSIKKIMVSEYVSDDSYISNAYNENYRNGFICFVRDSDNYDYVKIPNIIINENSTDIKNLSMAKNYLYLINPENYSSKQELIDALSNTNFDVILMDLFFKGKEFTKTEINQLKTKANGGKRLIISYISIGSAEKFRYYWKKKWRLNNPHWIKKKYEDYKDEFWVEFWDKEWQDIIFGNENSYIKKILNAGFDGAYLDNIEAYYFLYHDE